MATKERPVEPADLDGSRSAKGAGGVLRQLGRLCTAHRPWARNAAAWPLAAPFDKVLAVSNLPLFRYEWIWHKNKATGHLNACKMPLRTNETVLVIYKKPLNTPRK
jgi:hypothetical protein